MTYDNAEARWQTHAEIDAILGLPTVDYAAVDRSECSEEEEGS
jgi:hypothetical protein